jgi:hypothetical protein
MSRTYRRTRGDQQALDLRSDWWVCYLYPGIPLDVAKIRYKAHFHSDSYWPMATPRRWTNLQMTRPQRGEVRRLIRKVFLWLRNHIFTSDKL